MNMTREPILALLARKPFLPFRLYMTGRYVHEIRDPEYVEVRESVLEIKRPDPSAPGGKSWQCTLALDHVVSIEVQMCDEPTVVCPEQNERSEEQAMRRDELLRLLRASPSGCFASACPTTRSMRSVTRTWRL